MAAKRGIPISPFHTPQVTFGNPGRSGAKLTHLSLDSCFPPEIVKRLVELTHDTLEELDLQDCAPYPNSTFGSLTFPRLKKLRITISDTSTFSAIQMVGLFLAPTSL